MVTEDRLDAGPVPFPPDWLEHVNRPETEAELKALRKSVRRGTPFGQEAWRVHTARTLGLEHTMRPRGRPRRSAGDQLSEIQPLLFPE